jgi:AraC family L-rhamnose operon transcriptional activator RhaR
VLLVPPLHLHAYDNLDPQPTWLFTTFEWPGHTAMGETWRGARRLDTNARTRLDALIKAWRAPRPDGLLAAAHLLALLRHLFPRAKKAPQTSPAVQGGLIAAVRAAAEVEPAGKLRALAHRMGISESHLRARFRDEAGISLGRYLREARLRQSAIWLREEDISIKTAAERAGYPDIYTFSRAFRRSMGTPPSQVRDQISRRRGR